MVLTPERRTLPNRNPLECEILRTQPNSIESNRAIPDIVMVRMGPWTRLGTATKASLDALFERHVQQFECGPKSREEPETGCGTAQPT